MAAGETCGTGGAMYPTLEGLNGGIIHLGVPG